MHIANAHFSDQQTGVTTMQKHITHLILTALLGAAALPAGAVPFSANPADTPGPLNGGSVTYTVTSPGASAPGAATLTFDLLGYLSVDGANCCTDTFSLTVNGNPLFSGGFNMGGGGSNFINFIDPGVTIVSSYTPGMWGGGLTQFSVAHTLLSGANTYLFDYGNMQGLGDEGWGLHSVAITADVSAGGAGGVVPEPATLALIGLGLAGLGVSRRRVAA
ncbi:MAG: PEP-CTERM sorting domain-containing protein [Gallionella sp.]|nr:MAG: PEP-CTERM sorting domain-containing protein [Gallionella sp.]